MILKIDTTDNSKLSTELSSGTQKIDRMVENHKAGSQILLPQIIKMLKRKRKTLSDLSEIEVSFGPGSFTGTRIGVAIANSLGFALNIPVNGKKGKIVTPVYQKSKFDL